MPRICKFDSSCTRKDCWFEHPSRTGTETETETGIETVTIVLPDIPLEVSTPVVKVIRVCKFDSSCRRKDCWFSHPSRESTEICVKKDTVEVIEKYCQDNPSMNTICRDTFFPDAVRCCTCNGMYFQSGLPCGSCREENHTKIIGTYEGCRINSMIEEELDLMSDGEDDEECDEYDD